MARLDYEMVDEMEMTARYCASVHESAHAVTALALGKPIFSIEVDDSGAGLFRQSNKNAASTDDAHVHREMGKVADDWKQDGFPIGIEEHLAALIIVQLAGSRANYRLLGDLSGCGSDFDHVCDVIALLPEDQQAKFRLDACRHSRSAHLRQFTGCIADVDRMARIFSGPVRSEHE